MIPNDFNKYISIQEMLLSWIMFKYISVADSENYSGYWGIQICELSGFLTDSFLLFSSRMNK